jgi:hypothetical protein
MEIEEADSVGTVRTTASVSSAASCLERFKQNPDNSSNPIRHHRHRPRRLGTRRIHPMDPEIIRDQPGACPIWWMALGHPHAHHT